MTLTDRTTGEAVYPVTSARCVIDNNGVDADTRLKTLETAMPDKVDAVPGMGLSHEDYTAQDKAKVSSLPDKVQRALTPSDDFVLSPAGTLSLTEEAKLRIFIDLWNAACGQHGRYNEETGYFELNGLTDITYEQAIAIYQAGRPTNSAETTTIYRALNIRTNLPWLKPIPSGCEESFFANSTIEVARVAPITNITGVYCLYACPKLHTVIGDIRYKLSDGPTQCYRLVNVTARMDKSGGVLRYSESPRLSIESVRYSVDNSQPCTIMVHADTYAKLTGDTTNPAAAALTPQELAQWMEVLTDAVDKNITFATA